MEPCIQSALEREDGGEPTCVCLCVCARVCVCVCSSRPVIKLSRGGDITDSQQICPAQRTSTFV